MKKIIALIFLLSLLVSTIHSRAAAAPKVNFAASEVSVRENVEGGKVDLTVNLSESSTSIITVAYSADDIDAQYADYGSGRDYYLKLPNKNYTQVNKGSLVFLPGETSKKITVYITNDEVVELDEKFKVTLSHPQNADLGPSRCYVTIIDNDRNHLVDVKKPGYGLSPLKGDGKTDETIILQAMLDYFKSG